MLSDVRRRGDAAVLDDTRRFDRLEVAAMADLELEGSAPAGLRWSARAATGPGSGPGRAIRAYHERQKAVSRGWYTEADGTRLGQKVTALDRVGLYVPGGKAAYPSSVLMNAIPAKVAGVGELIMVVPTPGGHRNDLVLAAAHLGGVDRVFTIGGAQADAALAYGTATMPQVDKIVGPGNAYVASGEAGGVRHVGIDMVAGPFEVLIIADGSPIPIGWRSTSSPRRSTTNWRNPSCSAPMPPSSTASPPASTACCRPCRAVTSSPPRWGRGALIQRRRPRRGLRDRQPHRARASRTVRGRTGRLVDKIRHAGAIFIGHYTSESLGDYCAGPNHVLPTSRSARFSSPLGVYDFQKRSSLIEVSAAGAQTLGPIAATLAHGEGLTAHARAAELRLKRQGFPSAPQPARRTVRRYRR